MSSRAITLIVGSIILLLGLTGLIYPERVMGVLGFTLPAVERGSAALGEIRATYGGLFVVMGVYTLLAAADPAGNRARLLFIGLLWLGACAGRLLGAYIDGNPGLFGWLAASFEVLMSGALIAASQMRPTAVEPAPQIAPVAAPPA